MLSARADLWYHESVQMELSKFKNKIYTLHSAGVRSFRLIVCYRHCAPLERKSRDAKSTYRPAGALGYGDSVSLE